MTQRINFECVSCGCSMMWIKGDAAKERKQARYSDYTVLDLHQVCPSYMLTWLMSLPL
jgi:hypothetical protein